MIVLVDLTNKPSHIIVRQLKNKNSKLRKKAKLFFEIYKGILLFLRELEVQRRSTSPELDNKNQRTAKKEAVS